MTDWEVLDPDDERTISRSGDVALARSQVDAAVLPPGLEPVRRQVCALCDGPGNPLDRDSLPDHLTASAVVVAPGRGALLLHHRKLDRWFQPGGHVDGDGNLLAAACREATEETGLVGLRPVIPAVDLDVHDVPYPDGSFHIHHDLRFLLLAPSDAVADHNHESLDSRWVTGDADLDAVDADESTRRLVHRGLEIAALLTGTADGEPADHDGGEAADGKFADGESFDGGAS